MPAQRDDAHPQSIEGDQPAPTLSVTVLNYNYAHYLPQCLDSILRQSWTDFELILINDRSTDNSLEVIEPYLTDPRVKLVNHEQNKGYIASLIEGSELSRGKYITVISADDFCVCNRAFESLLRPMEADDEVVLAYSAHGHYDSEGRCGYHRQPHPQSFVRSGVEEFRQLILENYILHSGTIIRQSAYQAVGGYDPSFRYAPDTFMWLLLCGKGKVAYCADELYAYRVHVTSMSVSRTGIQVGLQEGLAALKQAFSQMQGAPGIDETLHMRAIKRSLTAVATDDVFRGDWRSGWYAYWCAVRMHPVLTVYQSRTLVILARTALGQHRFDLLRGTLRRPRATALPV
jgi:hypothetical protein